MSSMWCHVVELDIFFAFWKNIFIFSEAALQSPWGTSTSILQLSNSLVSTGWSISSHLVAPEVTCKSCSQDGAWGILFGSTCDQESRRVCCAQRADYYRVGLVVFKRFWEKYCFHCSEIQLQGGRVSWQACRQWIIWRLLHRKQSLLF